MSTISTQDAALRLARAILADIQLYNEEKIVLNEDMSEELAEGAALFHSRVTPDLRLVWDHCIATEWLPMVARRQAEVAAAANEPPAPAPQAPVSPARPHGIAAPAAIQATPRPPSDLLWMAFGAVGLGGVLAWYLLR